MLPEDTLYKKSPISPRRPEEHVKDNVLHELELDDETADPDDGDVDNPGEPGAGAGALFIVFVYYH